MGGRSPEPLPADFAANAAKMNWDELRQHYSAGYAKIARWKQEIGAPPERRRYRELPANIVQLANAAPSLKRLAKTMGWAVETVGLHLRLHHPDVHAALVARGLETKRGAGRKANLARHEAARLAREAKPKVESKRVFVLKPKRPQMPEQAAAVSKADRAMRWLQKVGPCYPLRIYGKSLPGYRFMGRVWQDDELIAEAVRRGWEPDAWARLAA